MVTQLKSPTFFSPAPQLLPFLSVLIELLSRLRQPKGAGPRLAAKLLLGASARRASASASRATRGARRLLFEVLWGLMRTPRELIIVTSEFRLPWRLARVWG